METILYITLVGLLISNIFFIWRGIQLVKQIEELQTELNNSVEYAESALEAMLNEMREIDLRGSFESDDEVGVVFGELKSVIEKYKNNL